MPHSMQIILTPVDQEFFNAKGLTSRHSTLALRGPISMGQVKREQFIFTIQDW